jgi:GAF domain-containing protein
MRSAGGRRKARASPKPPRSAAKVERQLEKLSAELRLRTAERDEALAQQAATAKVLQVINSSPGDLAPVFEAILEKARNLCGVAHGALHLYDGERFRAVAVHGASATLADRLRQGYVPGPKLPSHGLVEGARFAQVHDWAEIDDPIARVVLGAGFRTTLFIPLRKDGTLLGQIAASRREVNPFVEKEIAILESFAAQAVIAIENARLLTEQREALEQQTATAEVLQVINSSPGELTPVFEAILEKAHRLCAVSHGSLQLCDGETFRAVAVHGLSEAFADRLRQGYIPGPNVPSRRVIEGARFAHVADLGEIDDPVARAAAELSGIRTTLFIPLRKDGVLLGQIVAARQEVRPFTEKEIRLLESFAAQAVIAMENARLLGELRQRTRDLEASLEYQTATSDVLKLISRSTFDLKPVLGTLAETAARLCEAEMVFVAQRDGDAFRYVAVVGSTPEATADAMRFQEYLDSHPISALSGRRTMTGRVMAERRPVQIVDITTDPDYQFPETFTLFKTRALLGVPLLRDGEPIGIINLARQRAAPFTEQQIDLVRTFADQAVIAIENTRLLTEQREALEQQTATAEVLQVINASPGDLAPVFEVMLEKAMRLCEAAFGGLWVFEGDRYVAVALRGVPPAYSEYLRVTTLVPGPGTAPYRFLHGERSAFQNTDLKAEEPYRAGDPQRRALVELGGARTALQVPLVRDDVVRGVITIYRQEVRPFSGNQIALLQNFAAQAVIAMENARLITETREALERQTATAEVLQVINSSPGDLAPVFDAMLEKATRLCGAGFGTLWVYDGNRFTVAATHAVPVALAEFVREPVPVATSASLLDIVRGQNLVHMPDMAATELYHAGNRVRRAYVDLGGARTAISVALRKDNTLLGAFNVYRKEVRPFSDKEIALVQNFAAQAVIAIENARLITETREALEQQTATAEILQVINRSPGELAPVFDAILEKGHRLCGVAYGSLQTYDGGRFRAVAVHDLPEQFADVLRAGFSGSDHPVGRAFIAGERLAHLIDCAEIDHPVMRSAVELAGIRTALFVPLRRDEALLGMIVSARREVKPFTEKEIALLESFAAQAVIAMENARLLNEVRHRNEELAEALEFQTATGEVLRAVASSPDNLQSVFDAMLEKAIELCEARFGTLFLLDEKGFAVVADRNLSPAYARAVRGHVFLADENTGIRRLVESKSPMHIRDLAGDPTYVEQEPLRMAAVDLGRVRSLVAVPLLKKDEVIGFFSIYRSEPGGFAENQIALVATFADQAVIAIENARLITETREALEQQTATAEVLQVINSSPGDLAPVFDAMLEKATLVCSADAGVLATYDGECFWPTTWRGFREFSRDPIRPHPELGIGRVARGEDIVHILDSAAGEAYRSGDPARRAIVELGGARTQLTAALRKEGKLLGSFTLWRREVRAFTEKEIALLQNFAAQAVIAMENARLLEEIRHRNDELAEALEFQTATGEVLRIVASSPDHLQPVFDAMLEKGTALCEATYGFLVLYDGDAYRMVAGRNLPPAVNDILRTGPHRPGPNTALGRVARTKAPVHMDDVRKDIAYAERDPWRVAAVESGGARTQLAVPLLKKGELIGAFIIYRQEPVGFSETQIALVTTFADQAVIAIENARLFDELRERQAELARSVDELTATGDVLKIISRSSVDLETVLDTLVETVARLCRADQSYMFRRRDDANYMVAAFGLSEEAKEFIRTHPAATNRSSMSGRVTVERRAVHIPDVLEDSQYTYTEGQKVAGFRTMLGIPLLREDLLLGIFVVTRTRVEPFTKKEIELVQTFADQAVIAIENARLFDELRDRQAELARSVDELTATGDVLKIISRSSVDLETVLDTLVETVARLCRAEKSYLFRRRDDNYHLVTACGLSAKEKEFFDTHPFAADRGSLSGRVELERRPVHIPDVLADADYTYPGQQAIGYRTLLGIPLLRHDTLLGVFVVNRMQVEPFTDKEIELATTFADQAVIAIENARLFEELRERQAELRVTFDNMGDGVAMFDAERRLAAWNRNLQEMLELPHTFLAERPSYADLFRYLAERGEFGSVDLEAELRRNLDDTSREIRYERTRPDGRVIEVRRNPVPGGGFVLIYADITERKRAEAQISAARDAAETALRELQTAQASLLHSQKMAALGQLTAGIAHEIKNPLNFVNNFAGLSNELLTELRDVTTPAIAALDDQKRAEFDETLEMLTGNLKKIVEHGRRADGIVKSMLAHSRGGSGDWQAADLNALVEEALNLAYHGARAQDQSFNITMERDFDRGLGPVELVPQDVTRVFLNLIGNGFYAANKRKRDGDGAFRPVLRVATRDLGDSVEIKVRDNGIGIAAEHRERLFQPFFTTKPTGEGTGLGLSISYDIITQQHGGAITVDSEVGAFTEFTVRLPRRRHVAGAGGTRERQHPDR